MISPPLHHSKNLTQRNAQEFQLKVRGMSAWKAGGVVLSGGNGGRDDLEVLRLAGLCEGFTYSPTTPLITLS